MDSDREHQVLEDLLERRKPAHIPNGVDLHYLLKTPFRYPPLRHGSRFGTRQEAGIWYGSESLRGCFAEVAYYRFVFLEHSAADLSPLSVELSLFRASVASNRGVDLVAVPFEDELDRIASPTDYRATQELGADLRAAGLEAFRYPSARLAGAVNVGLFTPKAFQRRAPYGFQSWYCVADEQAVEITRRSYFERRCERFERGEFEVAGRLPSPSV